MSEMLTDARIKSLRGNGLQQEYRDGAYPLRLVVQPSGAKSFQYRWKRDGKSRRHTFGYYPDMTLAEARDAALRFKSDLKANKVEPVAPKIVEHKLTTVAEAFALFLESDKIRNGVKAEVAKEYVRAFEKDIEPYIGERPLVEITYEDIEDIIDRKYGALIKLGGKGIGANRLQSSLSGFLRWCKTHGRTKTGLRSNPMEDMPKRASENADTRFFSDEEIGWFFAALPVANGFARPYELLLRTVSRRAEIMTLTWGMIQGEAGKDKDRIILPTTKNGRPHAIYLTPSCLALIGDRPKDAAEEDRVFAVHPAANSKPVDRIRAKMIEIAKRDVDHWKLHSFRRTATTIMASLHDEEDRQLISPHVRDRLLNHTDSSVRGRHYDMYDNWSEKKAALILWGDHLDKIKVKALKFKD